jgi:hypothetical protein
MTAALESSLGTSDIGAHAPAVIGELPRHTAVEENSGINRSAAGAQAGPARHYSSGSSLATRAWWNASTTVGSNFLPACASIQAAASSAERAAW